MFWELLEILKRRSSVSPFQSSTYIVACLIDHAQGAFENGVEDLGHLRRDSRFQLGDNGRHRCQYFGFSSRWNIALVVEQDSVEQWRNEVCQNLKGNLCLDSRSKQNPEATYHIVVFSFRHPCTDQTQYLRLHAAHTLDQRLLQDRLSMQSHRSADVLRRHFVYVQHIQIDTAQLKGSLISSRS